MKAGYVFLFCLSVWVAGYIGHRFNSIRIKDLETKCEELKKDLERERALTMTLTMQSGLYAKSIQFYEWGLLLRDSGLIEPRDLDSNLNLIFRLENLTDDGVRASGFSISAGTILDILRENLNRDTAGHGGE